MALTRRTATMQDITLGKKELEAHAERLALEWKIRMDAQPEAPSLEPDARRLLVAYTRLHTVAEADELPPAAEWLLDNYYLLEENIRDLRERLDELGGLPCLSDGNQEGVPRAYMIAYEIVSHSEGYIDESAAEDFVNAFQRESALTMGEIWALPIMLRVALVQLSAEIALSCLQTLKLKHRGAALAAECAMEPRKTYTLLSKNNASLEGAFLETLTRRLETEGAKEALTILDMQLSLQDIDPKKSIRASHQEQAHMRVLIGNAITSLRLLSSLPWQKTFERLSVVERTLREDEVYTNMDYDSRAYYRKNVERAAARLRVSESQVAKTAVALMKGREGREAHVGYFLIDKGKQELTKKLRPSEARDNSAKRFRMYVGGIAALSLLLVAPMTLGLLDYRIALAVLLCAVPAFSIAKTVMDRFLVWITPPSFMPRLVVSGEEEELRAVVVVPALIADFDDAQRILEQLKVASIANAQKELSFILLADFPNSDEQKTDSGLSERIAGEFKRQEENGRFIFMLRKRVECPDGSFGGWERKRGALMDFNELLLGGDASAFELISSPTPKNVRYVITLDADTVLPHGAASLLIGAIAHPLNRPELSREGKHVENGHALLQPRISILPKSAAKSRFARIYSGSIGVDSYAFAVSDVYQDVFDEGIFTGKGIYDVSAFMSVTRGMFPENRVLSHDLIEGSLARAGLISDVTLYDSFPRSYRSHSRRQHRWTRGDWQLLPFMGARWKTADGEYSKNPLNALDKFKLLDNLRRSLVPVAVMASLLLAFSGFPVSWALLSLVALLLPLLLDVGSRALQWMQLRDRRPHLVHMLSDLKNSAVHVLLCALFLPQDAYAALDAIIRTLLRLLTKKRMLEWETAAHSERGFSESAGDFYREMPASIVSAALTVALSMWRVPDVLFIAALSALAWLFAPLVASMLSRPAEKTYELTKGERAELKEYALATWQYFDKFMTKEYGFLPPDNVQETPKRPPAARTSPTNIGLGMLALVCAFDLGYIKMDQMLKRLDGALKSLESAEKWHGNLYNWYELPDMRPMQPRFVSTVDSGNFVACAMAVEQALLEIEGCEETAGRIKALTDAHSLSELYDEERDLFCIGMDIESGKRSESHYDLLASEVRLTSFIAIARGEVPERHWFKLGRSLTTVGEKRSLVSWSGTMFEYLMPLLLMENYPYTLLDETYVAAVDAQKRFTDGKRPWGVSESGFYEFDLDLHYQYRAFGIPRVGLKSAAVKDIVIAPYASVLALMVDTRAALENLRALKAAGAFGKYGFYEALDYTPERVSGNNAFMMVKSFMSHHQGMSFVALANLLCDNRIQRRFHSMLIVKANELLLQERVPHKSVVIREYREALPKPVLPAYSERSSSIELKPTPASRPEAHLLGGQDYSVCLTSKGGGFSRWGDVNVNRWRADHVKGLYGMYFYIAEQGGSVWSPCVEPLGIKGEYKARFEADKVVFERKSGKIRSSLAICVSPEYPAEIRRLTLINEGDKGVSLQVSAFFEVSLAKQADDVAHPAFQNLFIEAEAKDEALCFKRRKRREEDPERHLAVALHGSGELTMNADRLSFIGRARTPETALRQGRAEIENPIDPAACMTREVYVKAGEKAVFTLAVACGDTREGAAEIALSFAQESVVERTYSLAWTHAQVELHAADDVKWFPKAVAPLLFPDRRLAEESLRRNTLPREGLWRLGISGDWTMLLAEITGEQGIGNVKLLLNLHEYLRRKGMKADFILLCMRSGEYHQSERERILETIRASSSRHALGVPGGIHLISIKDISDAEHVLLRAVSALCIDTDKTIGPQFTLPPLKQLKAIQFPRGGERRSALALERPVLQFDNGIGGFSLAGDEYVIRLREGENTPMPWCNVLSNGKFGTIVSERGGGFSFTHNARENSLTPWKNDPVSDPLVEQLLLRDNKTGRSWCVTQGNGEYVVRHGFGYSRFEHGGEGLKQALTIFIDPNEPVKVYSLEILNPLAVEREISVTLAAEWTKERVCDLDGDTLLARDPADGGEMGFMAFPGRDVGCCCDRSAFYLGGVSASWGKETRGDCALGAVMTSVCIPPGTSVQIIALLGEAQADEVRGIVDAYMQPDAAQDALMNIREVWRRRFTVQAHTPDDAFDLMMNGWLLYQVWSSRLLGRTGYYQAGGAYGFRDQLQDTLSLLHSVPERTKEQVLIAAGHQFEAGDVQHWWHPPAKGVRTLMKDDRLFLPYVAMAYADTTGDLNIWDEQAPYLADIPMGDRLDVYEPAKTCGLSEPIFDHCVRAIDATLNMGEHGLPLIGTGDWNDGMDEVGVKGKGESVWLGFFLLDVMKRFGDVCQIRGREDLAKRYEAKARSLERSLEEHGWDGEWYRRAYFDDGTPLGSAQNAECRIDLISQAWAILSGGKDKRRCDMAMKSALDRLLMEDEGVLRLLAPSFDKEKPSPGYIRGYTPGVRENGGQYTHGAAWALLALAKSGKGDMAVKLFSLLNPIAHTATRILAARYKGEPYVMAADVYSARGHEGRAGWTWYTGAASWMYQAGLEGMLGVTRRGNKLTVRPAVLCEWPQIELEYRYLDTTYFIKVREGEIAQNQTIDLINDGKSHEVTVTVPSSGNGEVILRETSALNKAAKSSKTKALEHSAR